MCCWCRDAGVKAIESLMEKKGKFDYILLETTGLADPGPIASMFWLDEGLGSEIYLDGKTYKREIFKAHNFHELGKGLQFVNKFTNQSNMGNLAELTSVM